MSRETESERRGERERERGEREREERERERGERERETSYNVSMFCHSFRLRVTNVQASLYVLLLL